MGFLKELCGSIFVLPLHAAAFLFMQLIHAVNFTKFYPLLHYIASQQSDGNVLLKKLCYTPIYFFFLFFLHPFFFSANWIGMCKQFVSCSSAKKLYHSSRSPSVTKGIAKTQKLKMLGFNYLSEADRIKIGKPVILYMHNSWARKSCILDLSPLMQNAENIF